jgi:aldehyde:ferredoxin oxidoreductase
MILGGRILDIDLTTGRWRREMLPPGQVNPYLGGRGANIRCLWEAIPRGIEPLSERNVIVLSGGLLTGSAAPVSSRLHVSALSPLTGLLGSSNIGGDFGGALRSCGIVQLILRGRSAQPVYLRLDGDTVEIRNAGPLWGCDTRETVERLRRRHGSRRLQIITIGPGGENGCLFGCIMSGRHHAAGRTGMGTVLGSKNVKAVVVKEQKGRRPSGDPAGKREAIRRYLGRIRNASQYEEFARFGGAGYVKWADDMGILGTRNYHQNRFEAIDRIDGKQLEKNVVGRRGCRGCPVRCKAELKFSQGRLQGSPAVRPEFEPMLALGAKCGLSDLEWIVYLDNLCSRLGIDNISTGTVIAFAMDLYAQGLIGPEETGGLALEWGNGEVMETLIRQIAVGEGFGGILNKGVLRAAQLIGGGAVRYAPHVKGLEMAGYHPDNVMGTALGYTVASRGADYSEIYATLENQWLPDRAAREFGTPDAVDLKSIRGKAELVRRAMVVGAVLDSLGICKVPALSLICAYDLVAEAEVATAVAGCDLNVHRLFAAGERIVNLERLFNLRHGASAADDRLPDMFFEKEYNAGHEPSKPFEWMEPMIQDFYRVMGWDSRGRPTPRKLAELGIRTESPSTQTAA